MEAEKLALEVQVTRVGWKAVMPPRITGRSGVVHAFSFLASDGRTHFAFDIYNKVTPIEVLNTYVKSVDTGVQPALICVNDDVTDEARSLAKEYGMKIITATGIPRHFDSVMLEKPVPAKRAL